MKKSNYFSLGVVLAILCILAFCLTAKDTMTVGRVTKNMTETW